MSGQVHEDLYAEEALERVALPPRRLVSLHERLVAAWRASGLPLGKLMIRAADAYALGASVSLSGLADVALVEMCERFVREHPEPAPCDRCAGSVQHHHFGCPVAARRTP